MSVGNHSTPKPPPLPIVPKMSSYLKGPKGSHQKLQNGLWLHLLKLWLAGRQFKSCFLIMSPCSSVLGFLGCCPSILWHAAKTIPIHQNFFLSVRQRKIFSMEAKLSRTEGLNGSAAEFSSQRKTQPKRNEMSAINDPIHFLQQVGDNLWLQFFCAWRLKKICI